MVIILLILINIIVVKSMRAQMLLLKCQTGGAMTLTPLGLGQLENAYVNREESAWEAVV